MGACDLVDHGPDHDAASRALLADEAVLAWLYPDLRPGEPRGVAFADWRQPLGGEPGDRLVVVRSADRTVVGGIRVERSEMSFFTGSRHWRRGYGRAAVGLLAAEWRRASFGRLVARVDRDNAASIRVLEATGFVFAGFAPGAPRSRRHLRYVLG